MKHRRITEKLLKLILSARKSGKSYSKIGKQYHLSVTAIRRHIQLQRENGAFATENMESDVISAETASETVTATEAINGAFATENMESDEISAETPLETITEAIESV